MCTPIWRACSQRCCQPCLNLPSSGLLALACVPKGVVEGPLGDLPVSEPSVCYDTGLHCMGVDAARLAEFLRNWACRVCDGVPRCVRRYLVCGERERGGGVNVRPLRWGVQCLCERLHLRSPAASVNSALSGSPSGVRVLSSSVLTPPASSESSAEAPEAYRLGARQGGRCKGAPLSRSESRAWCTRVWVRTCMCICVAGVWPPNWQAWR